MCGLLDWESKRAIWEGRWWRASP